MASPALRDFVRLHSCERRRSIGSRAQLPRPKPPFLLPWAKFRTSHRSLSTNQGRPEYKRPEDYR
jgi:hypothetical protein